jgi:hypothetical protein
MSKYYGVSRQLGEDFFAEFQIGIRKAIGNPRYFHFERRGLRRCNLDRFPYHFLYDIRATYQGLGVAAQSQESRVWCEAVLEIINARPATSTRA